ncbi:hypothetical protein [Sporosarcina sp. NPDC096371]|uniref:hypothetical protein n=1 Tax=Sporosarcina sp. NPDC096371 TaxID=3364530 RepID=UPI00381CBF7F
MKKTFFLFLTTLLVASTLFLPQNASASNIDVVAESKSIYVTYFQQGKHVDKTKLSLSHNGYGSKNSTNPGFFRAAQDALFLTSLYNRLNKINDPLASSVRADAIATLDHIKARMDLSKTKDSQGWYNSATHSPDTSMLLLAFSKAYGQLDLNSTQKASYNTIMNEMLVALQTAKNRHISNGSVDKWVAPSMASCGAVNKSKASNNIFALAAGGIGSYALNVGGTQNPYRGVMTDFASYVRDTQLSNGLWLIGGGRPVESCQMAVGYDTWSVMGSALAGMGSTGVTTNPNSSFFTAATKGVSGLNAHYLATNRLMTEYSNGITGSGIAAEGSSVPSYALAVSYVGTAEAKTLFNSLYPAAKSSIELPGVINSDNGAPKFHRLIQGLSGALDNNF